jgi:aspartyl protease family protein
MTDGFDGRLLYLLILLAAVVGWTLVEHRKRPGTALRALFAWALIFVGVIAAYGIWTDVRSSGRGKIMVMSDSIIDVERSRDGHYHLRLRIGDELVDFMVDTGATNIVLSLDDAERVGIDLRSLSFVADAQTANGVAATAPVQLLDVQLGPWTDPALPARVNAGMMETSLLGMDYLSRFDMHLSGDRMILRR